jgi:hypothetical protein
MATQNNGPISDPGIASVIENANALLSMIDPNLAFPSDVTGDTFARWFEDRVALATSLIDGGAQDDRQPPQAIAASQPIRGQRGRQPAGNLTRLQRKHAARRILRRL